MQIVGRPESLFEHADERAEVPMFLIAEIVARSGGALTVQDHQFRQAAKRL